MSTGNVASQALTFFSTAFETGVRNALNLNENDVITAEITDTVMVLDLSGSGLSDIRDIIYFPNISVLNLSGNVIQNISPLVNLTLLSDLDISNNILENIDILIFTLSQKMTVNASLNYIEDFSLIRSDYHCEFTLIGEGFQRISNELQLVVGAFYTDIGKNGKHFLIYSAQAKEDAPVQLNYLGKTASAVADNYLHKYSFANNFSNSEQIRLLLGSKGDTTYIVPAKTQKIPAGAHASFSVDLPSDYRIRVYQCKNDNAVQVNETTISYTAPLDFVSDTLYFEFRKDNILKGYSILYLQEGANEIGNNAIQNLQLYINPATDNITIILPDNEPQALFTLYDMQGKVLIRREVNNQENISVSKFASGIYIYNVRTEKESCQGKIVKQ
jgi:hypothetical protein